MTSTPSEARPLVIIVRLTGKKGKGLYAECYSFDEAHDWMTEHLQPFELEVRAFCVPPPGEHPTDVYNGEEGTVTRNGLVLFIHATTFVDAKYLVAMHTPIQV